MPQCNPRACASKGVSTNGVHCRFFFFLLFFNVFCAELQDEFFAATCIDSMILINVILA